MMINRKPIRHVDLYSDAGRLEALYRDIDNPVAVAVIAHPHPLFGGTLHNKVVFRAARGLENVDIATLRFNFRGAGTSQGAHDQGEGEVRDMEAALNWMVKKHPGVKLIAGGFSFGSWVSSRVGCERSDVSAIFLLGAPVNKYDLGYLRDCDKPLFFLQGENDEHGNIDKLSQLISNCRNAESMIVNDADHFFAGQLDLVEQAMQEWATSVLEA